MNRITILFSAAIAIFLGGCSQAEHRDHTDATQTAAPAQSQLAVSASAVDLHNTVCPVSGDKVGTSKLTETYQGKVYHFCCDDCPAKFKEDPEKYAKAVAADPAKYGVK